MGLPRTTVRDWRRPTYQPIRPRRLEICPRCWGAARAIRFEPEDYAELLALYLGDGHIAIHPRAERLRLFLDAKYKEIVSEACALLRRCFIDCTVGCQVMYGGTMKIPYVYSQHLVCLFPQHGPGKKHKRRIELEAWQRGHFEAAPWAFLRGCIRSDGCCFINRTGPYEYLSYDFSNKSKDIVDLFVEACDRVGVFTRANHNPRGIWQVRVNRRESVGKMLEHVGVKR